MGIFFRSKGYVEIRETDLQIFRNFAWEVECKFSRLADLWEKDSNILGAPISHKQECLDKAAKYREMAEIIHNMRDIDTYDEYMSRMDYYGGP